ncbi:hypothetical protein FHS61_000815 [Altererythrobacter atlanticus]|uniref:Uncharacterized protein n=1 Tax=Croceibacterium atlanticum TaxID=1267766 RepID=A0A0F7KWF3_9SPHN|nr:hypothetical protein [Croceibacterium atlanticum]AKH43481.1 hypothetical protein WYH_02451 [Croceibacterium atlanticum]MBB5731811.1 hypothetical protein [Croceibacterium atlanticum]
MDEEMESLLVEVRASTQGFRSDIETMRGSVDNTLTEGFARAGSVLESGLLSAIRRGSLGFDDLKRVALQTLDQIAAQALQSGLSGISGSAGGIGPLLGGTLGALLGLPGRATGGPVSPNTPYLVGERGPELFVPTAAGRVEAGGSSPRRDLRVSIQIAQPRGTSAPATLRRSSRQVASQVRRALREF